ncbi:hypothetical protein [Lysobacter gummosus]|uniref:hypothetical protein n=1 Tax=Lysobacter gummosus TaxID=262324 RepID=UPI00363E54F2
MFLSSRSNLSWRLPWPLLLLTLFLPVLLLWLLLLFGRGLAWLVTRETRDTRRAAHMDVRRVPPWAGCPLRDLPAQAPRSWLLIRNSQSPFFGYF